MAQPPPNPGQPPPAAYWSSAPPQFLHRSRDETAALAHLMNLNMNPSSMNLVFRPGSGSGSTFLAPKKPRNVWKNNGARRSGNSGNNNNNSKNRKDGVGVSGSYEPPKLQDLQTQNRLKARKFFKRKKNNFNFQKPLAPRNTTSFLMRAKKEGGIASLVSPCPVTPAILPTPVISPASEGLTDMAKNEWGVDGYGSMNGFIRLKDTENKEQFEGAEEDSASSGGSESDVEEHVEVERRLDHDLSRFEMIYPSRESNNSGNAFNSSSAWGTGGLGFYDQETKLARLEEENLTLKERLFLMQREMDDLRQRLEFLECRNPSLGDGVGPLNTNLNSNNNNEVGSENDGAACSEKSVGDGDFEGNTGGNQDEEVVVESGNLSEGDGKRKSSDDLEHAVAEETQTRIQAEDKDDAERSAETSLN